MRYTSLCLKINSAKSSSKRLFLSRGSLLLVVLLLFSSLFYAFNGVSLFVSAKDPVYVADFIALQNAVNGADGFTIIGLTTDILIPSGVALIIPSGKDVALVSIVEAETAGVWKLVGAAGQDTITIEVDGKLTLGTSTFEGIVVTHDVYNDDSDVAVYGRGITVSFGSSLVMYSGEVFGNTADFIIDDDFFDDGHGGGVSVDGSFVMSGGAISNNRGNGFVGGGRGGGVFVSDLGSFVMSGGAISNNHGGVGGSVGGGGAGGGVYVNGGSFVMSGGLIDHNSANGGGGVYVNGGSFVMSGGLIEHNGSGGAMGGGVGGGVYCSNSFVMSGDAMIANNGANMGGGVFAGSISMMDNAMIANNHANIFGGGVNVGSISMMDNAMIANNHAGINGGGVFAGSISMMDNAMIANNHADEDGGGVYVSVSFSMVDNACVANNTAYSGGGGVYVSDLGSFVMGGDAMIADNTVDDGGVYDDHYYSGFGGGVFVSGFFSMVDSACVANNTAYSGGGVVVSGGSFVMGGDAIIANNHAIGSGGGVYVGGMYVGGGSFVMGGDAMIVGNSVSYGGGGGVVVYDGSFVMGGDAMIANNSARACGGVAVAVSGFFSMVDSACVANNAGYDVGGVFVSGFFSMVDSACVANNTAAFRGGVYVNGGSFVMGGDAIIANNRIGGSIGFGGGAGAGAGVYVSGGSFVMGGDAMIVDNTVSWGSGGGVVVYDGSFNMMDSAMVANNTANNNGGGVAVWSGGSFNMMDSAMVANNTASKMDSAKVATDMPSNGGGVFVSGGSFNMMDSAMVANNTAFDGGGVFVSGGGTVTLSGGVVSGNVASGNGGGVWITENNDDADFRRLFVDTGVVFSNNRACSAYSRNSTHDSVYADQIKSTIWSSPFTQGYNNYDISYVPFGASSIVTFDVIVVGSNALRTGAGNYGAEMVVVIDAGSAVAGEVFKYWTSNSSVVIFDNAEDAVTSFVMPAESVVVTAVFGVPADFPVVHVSSVTGKAGDEVTLTVSLVNNPGIASYSLTMRFPSELDYKIAENGDILSSNFYVATNVAGQVSVSANSPTGADVSTGTVLFTITFKIDSAVEDGVIINEDAGLVIGAFRVIDAVESDGKRVSCVFNQGQVVVKNAFYGDVNGDGFVDFLDVTRLLRYLWEVPDNSPFSIVNADTNGDGSVDFLDVTRLLRYLWEVDPSPLGPKEVIAPAFLFMPFGFNEPAVTVSGEICQVGDEVTLSVLLTDNPGIASFSLTMEYPGELIFIEANAGDIIGSNFRASADNGVVVVSATSENGADVTTGAILFTITFKVSEDTKTGCIDGIRLGLFRPIDAIESKVKRLDIDIAQGNVVIEEPPVVLVSAVANAKDFISIVEASKNSGVWLLSFKVTETYTNGVTKVVSYAVPINANNANVAGSYDLGAYTLIYDIKGNGSNIKDFRIVMNYHTQ